MRKFLGGILLILLIIVIVVPLGFSFIIQKQVNKQIKILNQFPGITAKIENYSRGWFTSHATIRLSLINPAYSQILHTYKIKHKEKNLTFIIDATIHTGPIILAHNGHESRFAAAEIDSTYHLTPDVQKYIDIYTDGKPAIESVTMVDFSKSINTQFKSPTFNYHNAKTQRTFQWDGIHGTESTTVAMNKISEDITIGKMTYSHGPMTLISAPIQLQLHMKRHGEKFWYGNAMILAKDLTAKMHQVTQFNLHNLKINQQQHINDNKINTDLKYNFDSITAGVIKVGPGDLHLSINNLDIPAFTQMNTALLQMAQTTNLATSKANQRYVMEIMHVYGMLLGKGTNIILHQFNLTMPQGNIHAKGEINIQPFDSKMPLLMALMQNTKAHCELRTPIALAQELLIRFFSKALHKEMKQDKNLAVLNPEQQAKLIQHRTMQQIQAWVKDGLLTIKGTDYIFNLNFPAQAMMPTPKPAAPLKHHPASGSTTS